MDLREIFARVAPLFLGDPVTNIAGKAVTGFITTRQKRKKGATDIEVPSRSPLMSVNYKLPEVQIPTNTRRLARIGNSDSLFPMYALALVEQSEDTNVWVKDNFKVDPGRTTITRKPQYYA
jgi:hypothetical protein